MGFERSDLKVVLNESYKRCSGTIYMIFQTRGWATFSEINPRRGLIIVYLPLLIGIETDTTFIPVITFFCFFFLSHGAQLDFGTFRKGD